MSGEPTGPYPLFVPPGSMSRPFRAGRLRRGVGAVRHQQGGHGQFVAADRVTIVVERLSDGKMRVTSNSWNPKLVLLRNQVFEVRNADGRLHVAREQRRHDEWDPPVEPYGPYAPGKGPRRDHRRRRRIA